MQSVVDYLRTNAPSHSPEALNAQLRQAGYTPDVIHAAWTQVVDPFATPVAVREPVVGGGGSVVVELDRGFPTRPVVLVVLGIVVAIVVAFVAIGLAGGGIQVSASRADSADEALKVAEEKMGLSAEEAAAAKQALGAGEIDVTLPKGWSKVDKGIWRDDSTGNNVNIMSFDAPDMTLQDVAPEWLAQTKATQGVVIRKGPLDATLDDMPAKRVYYTMTAEDTVVDGSQWLMVDEGKAHVVTGTLMPGGRDDADQVTALVDSLRIG